MWKLTVEQKRKSENSEYLFTEAIEFTSEDLSEITVLIERLAHMGEVKETYYKIERVKECEA